MKKLLLIALFASISFAGVAQKTNTTAVEKKLERSDKAIADERKAKNFNVWIDRANVLLEAATIYTSKLLADFPVAQVTGPSMLGEPTSIEEETVSGVVYSKYVYPKIDLFVNAQGNIAFWIAKEDLREDVLNLAYDALAKAKELNDKTFARNNKVKTLIENLTSEFSTVGRTNYMLGAPLVGAELFEGAFKTKELEGVFDTISLYFAGICYFEGGDFENAKKKFEHMISVGAYEDGMSYFYLAGSQEKLNETKEAIATYEAAFEKYPSNSSIMGGLINAYIASDENPEKLIELIKKAQEVDPSNVSLYLVEAQIWDKIGNKENAYAALNIAMEKDAQNTNARYNYAVFKIMESDAIVNEANKVDINDTKTYDAMMKQVEELRKESIVKLEECYALAPTDANFIDLLRQMYFVCRDYNDGEYQKKYDEFNAKHPAQ